ncbi:hypothetical protein vseg_001947 [Gypsophila vaccaria]
MDTQIAQLAKVKSSVKKQPEQPHETLNSITLRSGIMYEDSKEFWKRDQGAQLNRAAPSSVKRPHGRSSDHLLDRATTCSIEPPPTKPSSVPDPTPRIPEAPIAIQLSFPHRQRKPKADSQFGKFMKVVKNLQVTIPFTELLSQVSSYAKFMKEILTKKRWFIRPKTVAFTQ